LPDNKRYSPSYFCRGDFLIYLIPGSVVLASLVFYLPSFPDHALKLVPQMGSLGYSVFAVLMAYFLGHAIYPVSYLVRWVFDRIPAFGPNTRAGVDGPTFRAAYFAAIEHHTEIYAAEISRCHCLARLMSAMCVPSVLFVSSLGRFLEWYHLKHGPLFYFLGVVAAVGFAWRYKRYQASFHEYVLASTDVGSAASGPSKGSDNGTG